MSKGIEYQFCSEWKNWDEVDTFALQFYDVVLLPEIAEAVGYPVAEVMSIDCQNCVVSFYFEDESTKDYKFTAKLVLDTDE